MSRLPRSHARGLRMILLGSALLAVTPCARAQDSTADEVRATAAQLAAKGDQARAITALDDYLRSHADDSALRLELARYLAYSKRYAEATAEYQQVLARQPGNLAAQVGLAKIASWQGDFDKSLEIYDAVLAHAPHLYDARAGKGFTLAWMGRNDEALALLRSAQRAHPEDKEVAAEIARLSDLIPKASAVSPTAKSHAKPPTASSIAPIYPTTFAEPIAPPKRELRSAQSVWPIGWLVLSGFAALVTIGMYAWRRLKPQSAKVTSSAALAPEPRKRVLMLETNPSAAAFLRSVFLQWNVEIESCDDATVANERLRNEEFKYAVVDCYSVSADEAAALATTAANRATTLVFACSELAEVQAARQMGCRSVLKPFSIAELYSVLHSAPMAQTAVAAS